MHEETANVIHISFIVIMQKLIKIKSDSMYAHNIRRTFCHEFMRKCSVTRVKEDILASSMDDLYK